MIQQFLFSHYKGIHKYKLVNSLPVDAYAFIHPVKNLFNPRFLYK